MHSAKKAIAMFVLATVAVFCGSASDAQSPRAARSSSSRASILHSTPAEGKASSQPIGSGRASSWGAGSGGFGLKPQAGGVWRDEAGGTAPTGEIGDKSGTMVSDQVGQKYRVVTPAMRVPAAGKNNGLSTSVSAPGTPAISHSVNPFPSHSTGPNSSGLKLRSTHSVPMNPFGVSRQSVPRSSAKQTLPGSSLMRKNQTPGPRSLGNGPSLKSKSRLPD